MSMKLNPKTNDWTRPKYNNFKPLHEVELKGVRVVLNDYLAKIELSQRSLAELCDLSQPAINDLCANRTQLFNMSHIIRVCSVLGCEISDIFALVPYEETAYSAQY
jgi:predicted XRE-type DNA-binding protein